MVSCYDKVNIEEAVGRTSFRKSVMFMLIILRNMNLIALSFVALNQKKKITRGLSPPALHPWLSLSCGRMLSGAIIVFEFSNFLRKIFNCPHFPLLNVA